MKMGSKFSSGAIEEICLQNKSIAGGDPCSTRARLIDSLS
jgi:hypothetical protein